MSAATILTLASGKGIDLLDPQPADVDFSVIAEHLAKEKRFNGATPSVEYSVAEHCVRGADAIVRETGDTLLAAYFLLHDAHEGVLKDDTTPKKCALAELAEQEFGVLAEQIMAVFRKLEDRHDRAIHEAAGLVWPPAADMRKAIKHWDLVMFVTEWRDVMGFQHPAWAPYVDILPLEHRIRPYPFWTEARAQYETRCWRLLPAKRRAA